MTDGKKTDLIIYSGLKRKILYTPFQGKTGSHYVEMLLRSHLKQVL